MNLFGGELLCDEMERRGGDGGSNLRSTRLSIYRRASLIESEIDEEWSTPLAKISRLYYDHESWSYAREILDVPSAACRKVGDEARGLASRHIIDRLKEIQYLERIQNVAPRLRSAVELLSKPDADYLYPPVQFVVNQLRSKYPEVYDSVLNKIGIRIPHDMKPKTVVVTIAKYVFENNSGEVEINWGKFISLLGLCGTLAVDSVAAGYSEGVTEVVDTFGLIIEQVMGEWILNQGGGWEGFIQTNQYEPILSPIPRTIVIVLVIFFLFYLLLKLGLFLFTSFYIGEVRRTDGIDRFLRKWGHPYGQSPAGMNTQVDSEFMTCSSSPRNPLQYLYSVNHHNF